MAKYKTIRLKENEAAFLSEILTHWSREDGVGLGEADEAVRIARYIDSLPLREG